jgi:hypothetical protein
LPLAKVRTAHGVFTLLATALIAAGCNKPPAAQVSRLTDHAQAPRLTDHAQAPRLTDEEIR